MKVLLFSVKAGYGHHSTAQAMMNYFKEKNIECEMCDILEYIDPTLSDSVNKGYLLTTKITPKMYGLLYGKLDENEEKSSKASPINILSNLVSHKLREYINDYKPDVIVGTHSFASMVITYLEEKKAINCLSVGIITDFTVHPFWENTSLDYYVLANEQLIHQAGKKGIPRNKILTTGIPVKEQFANKIPKADARRKLGFKDKKTILMMMGSMGFGNIGKTIQRIDTLEWDFQVICICGNNERMRNVLENKIKKGKFKKDIYVYGFVNNVSDMMDASDLIITKPGGLTTSEALAKHLPPIIMNPIPGQEDRNMEFLVNNGAAVMVTETFPIEEAIYELFSNDWRLDLLGQSVAKLSKPYAARDLCEFIITNTQNKNL